MAYTKNPTWVDGEAGGTLITAAKLNNIEDGIAAADAVANDWTYIVATTDTANSTVTAVNAAGLSIPALADGLYEFRGTVRATSANTATGAQIGLANNATGATVTAFLTGTTSLTATALNMPSTAQFPSTPVATGAPSATHPYVGLTVSGTIRAASMTGTVDVTVRTEVAASSVAVKADSFLAYRRVAA